MARSRHLARAVGAGAAALALLALTAPSGSADDPSTPGDAVRAVLVDNFVRVDPASPSPTGQSVAADCAGADDNDDWSDATARLRLRQRGGTSDVRVRVWNARPNTYYSLWLDLTGVDSNGDVYGGSPLTGIPGTPFVHTDDLPAMLEITPPAMGSTEQPNGFFTNGRGHGSLRVRVDFPAVGGAYPFQRFEDFDPTHPNLGADEPAIRPVAIPASQGVFTLRIASHCTDDTGHGLMPGPHENWFDWVVDE